MFSRLNMSSSVVTINEMKESVRDLMEESGSLVTQQGSGRSLLFPATVVGVSLMFLIPIGIHFYMKYFKEPKNETKFDFKILRYKTDTCQDKKSLINKVQKIAKNVTSTIQHSNQPQNECNHAKIDNNEGNVKNAEVAVAKERFEKQPDLKSEENFDGSKSKMSSENY